MLLARMAGPSSIIRGSVAFYSSSPFFRENVKLTSRSSSFPTSSGKLYSGRGCIPCRNYSAGASQFSGSDEVVASSINDSILGSQNTSVNMIEYIESVQQSGGKAAVLFSDAPPVLWTVEALCTIKDLPGMTWISTIICSTLLVRAIIGVPVAVSQNRSIARLELLKPELETLGKELTAETAVAVKQFKWDEKTARTQFKKSFKKHWRSLVESNNCHPMKNLALSLTQLPFWICFSSALRNVVYALPLPRNPEKIDRWLQIHNESTPWLESLVVPDPIVFPAVFLVMNLLNIELSRKQRLTTIPETRVQKYLPWVIRGLILGIAFIATSVPSAVSMYWATSSSLALAQNLLFASPPVKKFFKVQKIIIPQYLKKTNG